MIPSSRRMAGLWWRSYAELANWPWTVPAGRAGAWVPGQQASSHACPQPPPTQVTPSSSHLSIAGEETLPAPHGPRWVCEVGAGPAPAAGEVGELDRESLPMPGFSGASTHSSPRPPPCPWPHTPAPVLPTPAS